MAITAAAASIADHRMKEPVAHERSAKTITALSPRDTEKSEQA